IHAEFASVNAWAAVCSARRHGLPCVVTYRGSDVHTILAQRRKGWELCRDSFRFADLNVLVSRSLEEILRRHAEPTGKCEVLLRGVDQSRFFPASELPDNRHVLFVGNMSETKGVFDLVAAWSRVRAVYPDASLTLVGPDLTRGRLRR